MEMEGSEGDCGGVIDGLEEQGQNGRGDPNQESGDGVKLVGFENPAMVGKGDSN